MSTASVKKIHKLKSSIDTLIDEVILSTVSFIAEKHEIDIDESEVRGAVLGVDGSAPVVKKRASKPSKLTHDCLFLVRPKGGKDYVQCSKKRNPENEFCTSCMKKKAKDQQSNLLARENIDKSENKLSEEYINTYMNILSNAVQKPKPKVSEEETRTYKDREYSSSIYKDENLWKTDDIVCEFKDDVPYIRYVSRGGRFTDKLINTQEYLKKCDEYGIKYLVDEADLDEERSDVEFDSNTPRDVVNTRSSRSRRSVRNLNLND